MRKVHKYGVTPESFIMGKKVVTLPADTEFLGIGNTAKPGDFPKPVLFALHEDSEDAPQDMFSIRIIQTDHEVPHGYTEYIGTAIGGFTEWHYFWAPNVEQRLALTIKNGGL